MISLGHHVRDLGPSQPVLQSELVRGRPHHGGFDRVAGGGHVAEDGAADGGFLLAAPPAATRKGLFGWRRRFSGLPPHDQAD